MTKNQVIKKINTFYRSSLGEYKAADLLRAIRLEVEGHPLSDRLLAMLQDMEFGNSGPCPFNPKRLAPTCRPVSQEEWNGIIDDIIKDLTS